jgi:beta-fructofuranosidase
VTDLPPINDKHRPGYHFLPPKNWMNDPNGLIQWKGKYHLFYQYNPTGAYHANMHWGHAASRDLLHWEQLPIALAPTPGGYDKDGCFSGCAVVKDGVPTLMYTGVWPEVQCLAMSEGDDLIEWEKYAGNPVISGHPAGLNLTTFRDPCVWQEGDEWKMVVGATVRGAGGTILQYRSPDLINWTYEGQLLSEDNGVTGGEWECPGLFQLGDRHYLLVSITNRATVDCFTGSYDGQAFVPEARRKVDFGQYFYAPQTFVDERGRRIMIGWIWEGRSVEADKAAGWSGVQSLPRLLTYREDGHLGVEPLPELEQIRSSEHHHFAGVDLCPESPLPLPVESDQVELMVEVLPKEARAFGLVVRESADGRERTVIRYQFESGELRVDRRQSSLDKDVHDTAQTGILKLGMGEPLRLRVFVDHSVIEIFANGRYCLSSRIYPTLDDSLRASLFTEGGCAHITQAEVWMLRGTNEGE